MAGDSDRVVLEGVPRLGFYPDTQRHEDSNMRCPEDVCFPSCLRACLEYRGEGVGCKQVGQFSRDWGIGCGYAYLMGTTGAAFRLNWAPGWHEDNVAAFMASNDPSETFLRGVKSTGHEVDLICRTALLKEGADAEGIMRERIIHELRVLGRPVIAHGVIGPPEECIVTGYDEGGDVLIGWNFFQYGAEASGDLEFEPNGYFRKRNWYDETMGVVIVGEKTGKPDVAEVYRDALEFALRVVREPTRYHGRHNGLAAYDAWAEHLLLDDEFATDDPEELALRQGIHDDAVGVVAEGRWYGAVFLAQAAPAVSRMAEPLLSAAACYAAEHDLMWEIWRLGGGMGRSEKQWRTLADPKVRREIVKVIKQAQDRDAEAADHIERALAL